MKHFARAALACAAALACPARANDQVAGLADLTLEQLSNIVVSSVSRHEQPLLRTPASVYVITAEDIRRSGATSIPEALRLAPNLHVARVADPTQYAISARGANNAAANKLLTMIDGRTIYTPFFSGTWWDAQDLMLEDVDRIEVISGPGSTEWGANAVNGVINVITKRAADTQGALISAGAGNTTQSGGFRYGGALEDGAYRVYGKTLRRESTRLASGASSHDGGDITTSGFRADWGGHGDGFTLQGDAYSAGYDLTPQGRNLSGANLLARWNRRLDGGGALQVQAYYDYTDRDHVSLLTDRLDTFDIEAIHTLAPLGRHRVQWGGGIRRSHDDSSIPVGTAVFLPNVALLTRNNVFVQDEIALRPDVSLTLGAKVESNNYTKPEGLPTARIGWAVAPGHFLWAAASRAVRAPTRLEKDLYAPVNPPFTIFAGGPNYRSEVSKDYEIGYRSQPTSALSYSATLFYQRLESLRTQVLTPAGAVFTNDAQGRTHGIEAWGSWRLRPWWQLSAGITHMTKSVSINPGVVNLLTPDALSGNDPNGWVTFRSSMDLGANLELDVMARHVNALPSPSVPAYTALDARLGWKVRRDAQISLTLQNLTDPGHPEFGLPATRPEVPRSVFVSVRLTTN
ncbi:MAG TPA: TonB-dependent receptor [Burkholderiales bacterium]|nr:TonB-dependent receptor [Burkholderiales bacterium]